jgi:hypothetical protein
LEMYLAAQLDSCMQCVCLMCGTEAAAMNAIDYIPEGSRGDSRTEYVRLIVLLPPTQWEIFAEDPKYKGLIASLTRDVCDMLQRTRPLFVQYILDAMLQQRKSDPSAASGVLPRSGSGGAESPQVTLTPVVLSMAKERMLTETMRIQSEDGLYAQLALMHSEFLTRSVDQVSHHLDNRLRTYGWDSCLVATKGRKRTLGGEKKTMTMTKEELQNGLSLVKAQKLFCIRHHFGEMALPSGCNHSDQILPLFVQGGEKTPMMVLDNGYTTPFSPNVIFAPPSKDPLLYLLCLRDGISFANHRISTSFGFRHIYQARNECNIPMFLNTNQTPFSGKFLEMEMACAMITASHSYADALDGCPLSDFLPALVAEFNMEQEYLPQTRFGMVDVPPQYMEYRIPLLSPANAPWSVTDSTAKCNSTGGSSSTPIDSSRVRSSGSDVMELQDGTLVVGNLNWSANKETNDGSFPVLAHGQVHCASVELKSSQDNVPTSEVAKTFTNDLTLTLLVVTKAESIKPNNTAFNEAVRGCNFVRIVGNASNELSVATELKWETVHSGGDRTVVMIVLESIFHGRYAAMKNVYC